jgi:hypothetical protein
MIHISLYHDDDGGKKIIAFVSTSSERPLWCDKILLVTGEPEVYFSKLGSAIFSSERHAIAVIKKRWPKAKIREIPNSIKLGSGYKVKKYLYVMGEEIN